MRCRIGTSHYCMCTLTHRLKIVCFDVFCMNMHLRFPARSLSQFVSILHATSAAEPGWLPKRLGWLSDQKGWPLQHTKRSKRLAGLTMKPFHPSKSWFIPRISQSGFQNNKKYPKKPLSIRTRIEKNMNGCSDSIGTGSAHVCRMSTLGPKIWLAL